MIQKFKVSADPAIYEAWPDVALTKSGKLVCVFSECTQHGNREYTRIVVSESTDRGRNWSAKKPLTEGTRGLPYYYNCARITALRDGRLCVAVDRCPPKGESNNGAVESVNLLYFSSDEGATWGAPLETPLRGIVPDKLLELENGRWILAAHHPEDGYLTQFMRYSDDQGKTWSERITVGKKEGLNLCEVSIMPVGGSVTLVAFMRENSALGWDCKKTISADGGKSWGEVIDFPLPACHRPVAGHLNDGRVMITHRFMQGGKGWLGSWTQNFFAALTDDASALASVRKEAWARIMPVDFDRSPKSDTGYSGWVQFPDGEIYIVNYIVDDAFDSAQIRGYSLTPDEFLIDRKA
jgi:sialidase-1